MVKAKYKIGQKLYHINDGYVSCQTVQAILVRGEEVLYSFDSDIPFKYDPDASYYKLMSSSTYNEESLYPTKDALIKSIKESDVDDE